MTNTAVINVVIDPEYGDLWTGSVPIVRGSGLNSMQEVRVEVSCRDGNERLWKNSNAYLVNGEGTFDTATTPAVGDGYYGVCPEGPLTSLKCQDDGPGHDFTLPTTRKLEYQITIKDGEGELWSTSLQRSAGRPDDVPAPAKVRITYYDDDPKDEGRLAAEALAPYGVHLQYGYSVERSVEMKPSILALPHAIVACGRSSAKALEDARHCENLRAVILFAGGGLRFEPYKDLDYIPLDHSKLLPKSQSFLTTRDLYAHAVADREQRNRGRIAVEEIEAPLHLFSGLDDQIWPSSAFSELIAQRRKAKECAWPTFHQTFVGVGHDLGPTIGLPTLATTERSVSHPETGFRLLLGGKGGRQARARRECWDSLLNILNAL